MVNPTHHPLLVLIAQIAVLVYAVWAVHHRNDRRALPPDLISAIHGSMAFAAGTLLLSLALVYLSDGRKFMSVRQLFEVGYVASCGAVILVLRVLKGTPYDRNKKEEP